MGSDTNVQTGQCHCGAVRFEVTLSDGFNSIRRCTCSYCRMRGAVVAMAA
ncbi:MAG: GFA family protein, partial [Bradyrhizobiaceae bacterium]